jgi:hypothetical protein
MANTQESRLVDLELFIIESSRSSMTLFNTYVLPFSANTGLSLAAICFIIFSRSSLREFDFFFTGLSLFFTRNRIAKYETGRAIPPGNVMLKILEQLKPDQNRREA